MLSLTVIGSFSVYAAPKKRQYNAIQFNTIEYNTNNSNRAFSVEYTEKEPCHLLKGRECSFFLLFNYYNLTVIIIH